jgi:iron-sulfur cluster repair protein YtfE (RIC family)
MTQKDACALLDSDHEKVERLFAEYQSAGTDLPKKSQLAQAICMELTVHTTIEEEIFYPAFRKAARDNKLVDEAEKEHHEARDLIAQIEDAAQMDPLMAKLQKTIEHHVQEERQQMFPKARNTPGLDLMALAAQMAGRKAELMAGYHPV